jgi:hypothetical protein
LGGRVEDWCVSEASKLVTVRFNAKPGNGPNAYVDLVRTLARFYEQRSAPQRLSQRAAEAVNDVQRLAIWYVASGGEYFDSNAALRLKQCESILEHAAGKSEAVCAYLISARLMLEWLQEAGVSRR